MRPAFGAGFQAGVMSLFSRKRKDSRGTAPDAAESREAGRTPMQTLRAHHVSAAARHSSLDRQKARESANSLAIPKEHEPKPEPETAQEAASAEVGAAAAAVAAPRPSFWQRRFPDTDWGLFRIRLVFGFFFLVFVALWGRAWYLQMIEGPQLAQKARRQHITAEIVTGKRGMIHDRDGQVLARSVEALSVYANPSSVKDPLATANTLGPLIGVAPQKLYDQLSGSKKQFVWLKRKVDDYTAAAVREAGLAGVGLSKEYERVYPFKHMAGQLLGFVGFDDKGLEGLERALDEQLASESKREIVQRDAQGRRFYLRKEGEEDPKGEDVTLTIDVQMQFFAEEAIARAVKEQRARWGGALVVHVPSGEIMAWAQYPFFNPNNFRNSRPEIYRNRLAQDALEPGSTFKPLVLAAAMQERQVARNTLINCEQGRWKTKYTTLRDTSSRDVIPVHKVIRYSSNIGMAKIGLMMGNQTFYKYLREMGFGETSHLPVPDIRGLVRKPKDWTEVDHMSISFGQGISVTGIQMAQAYLTLLNNGIRKDLVLVKDMKGMSVKGKSASQEDRSSAEKSGKKQLFSESVARDIRRMMREVVEEKDGTGRRAAIEGVSVAGKTGTAQKADARTGAYGSKRLASFVGFLPVDKPEYLILVFIDEPQETQYGGVIAAPVFKEIAERTLAYSGTLRKNGTRPNSSTSETLMVHEGKNAMGRGFRTGDLESPFARKNAGKEQKTATELAELKKREFSAPDALKLPGHLAKASATVPDVTGKTLRNAVELFARAGVVPELKGDGKRVVRQTPAPGSPWPKADEPGKEKPTECILWLSEL